MRTPSSILLAAGLALAAPAQAQIIGPSSFEVPSFAAPVAANATFGFGSSLDVFGEQVLVGVAGLDLVVGGATRSNVGGGRILELDADGEWTVVADLLATDLTATSNAGASVALGGDVAVLGAPFCDLFGLNRGAVVVFERNSKGEWLQTATLAPPLPGSGEQFGAAVAIDGTRLILGAPGVRRAYVYERSTEGNWQPSFELPNFADQSTIERVALRGDRAFVSGNNTTQVFDRVGPDWNPTWSLGVSGPLAVDGDGTTVVIGRPTAGPFGTVEVHTRAPDGGWSLAQTIEVPAYEDGFGSSVALRGDRLLVGVVAGLSSATQRRAFLFERSNGSAWEQCCELYGDELASSFTFGSSVALTSDRAHVGMPGSTAATAVGALVTFDLGTLRHSGRHLSVAEGRDQRLFLRAGGQHAWHYFVMLGSASGTTPSTPLPGSSLALPLAFDWYTASIVDGSSDQLTFWYGPLDANGNAIVDFRIPPLAYQPYVGAELHHAYLVIDPATFAVDMVSNAVPLEFVP